MTAPEFAPPAQSHKRQYFEMLAEWEAAGEKIHPGTLRLRGKSFEEWLEFIRQSTRRETCAEGYVPSNTYFLLRAGRILGAVDVRHQLNENLLRFGGHIGCGVRPTERNKGYAGTLLDYGLSRLRQLGADRALLTCDRGNIASQWTIVSRGGVYENELPEENGTVIRRYWIAL